mmetsp:Transcript_42394/g.40636  ORF Transcript_42394/g.40636 Transcript_42394/m.40636 type:complete len:81 (+) Transcript_42394:963-1205(+)
MKKAKEDSALSILTIFSIEHILVAFAFFLKFMFDHEPEWVQTYHARSQYKKEEKRLKTAQTQKLGSSQMKKATNLFAMGK